MPVRITDNNGDINYLIPAPFVNINKSFDKQGDGEILGTRYTIQLDGFIVADRGSPTTDGSFINDGVDIIDPDLSIEGGVGKTGWYESLQNKQKAVSNLISKMQSGAYLEIDPLDASMEGFSAHVRLESVDLPSHDPGDPYKAKYTINMSCDYLIGPTDVNNDEDDWERQEKWMVSAASENWSIEENEQAVFDRDALNGFTDDGGIDNGALVQSHKTYTLTRTTSATGKNKFDRETSLANGLMPDGYTTVYADNGRAWQQARGYIYDIIKYGNQFIYGSDDTEYSYNPATQTPPTGDSSALTADPDDYHLFSMNLPVTGTDAYKSFNYKRYQNVDVKGGSFSVTETWTLAPQKTIATETVEISTSESSSSGEIQVTINGTIEGIIDNADNVALGDASNLDKNTERAEATDEYFNHQSTYNASSSIKIPENKYQNALKHFNTISPFFHHAAEGIAKKVAGSTAIDVATSPTSRNVTHQPARGVITYSITYSGSASGGDGNNFIPYVLSEEISVNDTYPGQNFAEQTVLGRRLGPVLQDIGTQTRWLREVTIQCQVDVRKPFLCVDAEDEPLTGLDNYNDCLGNFCEAAGVRYPNCTTESACTTDDDPCHNLSSAPSWNTGANVNNDWILNPNYVDIGTSNTNVAKVRNNLSKGGMFTTNMVTSKPGFTLPDVGAGFGVSRPTSLGNLPTLPSTNAGLDNDFDDVVATTTYDGDNNPDFTVSNYWTKHKQFVGIKKLLNSLDPLTYLGYEYGGTLSNTMNRGHVTKRFTNPPSESWNPKTGNWSYSISWVYELDDPYTTFSSSFFNSSFVDNLHTPEDPSKSTIELSRTSPGQHF